MLLHLTATWKAPRLTPPSREPARYRVADRTLEHAHLLAMLAALNNLGPSPEGYDERPWPLPVAAAWHAVNTGTPAPDAARRLWPDYARRVHDWLTDGQHATTRQRADKLAAAHAHLHTAILTPAGARR